MNGADGVEQYLRETASLLERIAPSMARPTTAAAGAVADTLRCGGKVLLCGNGGSAALAEHVACELVGRMRGEHRPWAAVALTPDSSVVTALGNDYGFEAVFARQVTALGRRGDTLVALSTSGSSPNVLAAARVARDEGMTVIGFTGDGGGPLASLCTHLVAVPSDDTPHVQEIHAVLAHAMCGIVEQRLTGLGTGENVCNE